MVWGWVGVNCSVVFLLLFVLSTMVIVFSEVVGEMLVLLSDEGAGMPLWCGVGWGLVVRLFFYCCSSCRPRLSFSLGWWELLGTN